MLLITKSLFVNFFQKYFLKTNFKNSSWFHEKVFKIFFICLDNYKNTWNLFRKAIHFKKI